MAKRFADLKKALKLIRNISSPGTPVTAPAGSALEKFQEFQNGTTVITVNRAADSLPKGFDDVAINPFGAPVDPGNLVKVKFSQRVKDDGITAVTPLCNHEAVTNTIPTASGFVPAKAIIFVPGTSVTTPNSNITGLKYTKKSGKSFTYPYGSKAGAAHESVVRTNITAAVENAGATNQVSFNSEEL